MDFPNSGDYIDIHTHGGKSTEGVFCIENLMAHEFVLPGEATRRAYSLGIHPWHLDESNSRIQLNFVKNNALSSSIIAIGEAGFDKLRGPSANLQRKVFIEQAEIAEECSMPVFIHCVRAWDELLEAHKFLRPKMIWIIHGFRGSRELAAQLLAKGFYLSFWYDFVVRPESSGLLKSLDTRRIFLETDGADIDIRDVYKKVSSDLGNNVGELKKIIVNNFRDIFGTNRIFSHDKLAITD